MNARANNPTLSITSQNEIRKGGIEGNGGEGEGLWGSRRTLGLMDVGPAWTEKKFSVSVAGGALRSLSGHMSPSPLPCSVPIEAESIEKFLCSTTGSPGASPVPVSMPQFLFLRNQAENMSFGIVMRAEQDDGHDLKETFKKTVRKPVSLAAAPL